MTEPTPSPTRAPQSSTAQRVIVTRKGPLGQYDFRAGRPKISILFYVDRWSMTSFENR